MKKILVLLSFVFFTSCQEAKTEQNSTVQASSSFDAIDAKSESYDFDKEKDESCDTEVDLEKKIEEAKKKNTALKLQGGDSGCSPDEMPAE